MSADLKEQVREAVSDFRKATFEFARASNPDDHKRMIEAQTQINDFAASAAARIEELEARVAEKDEQIKSLRRGLRPFALAYETWNGGNAEKHFSAAVKAGDFSYAYQMYVEAMVVPAEPK